MTPRQTALLPEDELHAWAQTLLPPARGTLQRLQRAALESTSAQLQQAIQRHLEAVKAGQQDNEFIDIDRAHVLAESAGKLIRALDSLSPQGRIVAAAAVLYFVTPNDAEDDLSSSVGFDDDAEVLESALTRLGI